MKIRHLENRMKLIKKMDKNRKYNPTPKELEKAYGYLNYCLGCGDKISFLEPYSHGFEGNCHRFGCSPIARISGTIYGFIKNLILIPLALICTPVYIIYLGIKEFIKEIKK